MTNIRGFVADTEVYVNNIGYIKITDLKKADVLKFNVKDFRFLRMGMESTVEKSGENKELVEVQYMLDEEAVWSVKCTPDTEFLVMSRTDVYFNSNEQKLDWVKARNLTEGTALVYDGFVIGLPIRIKSVKALEEKLDVFSLTDNFTTRAGVVVR